MSLSCVRCLGPIDWDQAFECDEVGSLVHKGCPNRLSCASCGRTILPLESVEVNDDDQPVHRICDMEGLLVVVRKVVAAASKEDSDD